MREGGERGRKEKCHHGGGHQETRDAVPAAAEVWKGTHTHTHTHTQLMLMLTLHGCLWISEVIFMMMVRVKVSKD